jgi:hypothetical protein
VHTAPQIASSREDDGLSRRASNGLRERLPSVSFPRKREGFPNALRRVWGPQSMRAAVFLDPRLRGGDKEGVHSRFILLEIPRQATSDAGLRTDDTANSRPDVSTPLDMARGGAASLDRTGRARDFPDLYHGREESVARRVGPAGSFWMHLSLGGLTAEARDGQRVGRADTLGTHGHPASLPRYNPRRGGGSRPTPEKVCLAHLCADGSKSAKLPARRAGPEPRGTGAESLPSEVQVAHILAGRGPVLACHLSHITYHCFLPNLLSARPAINANCLSSTLLSPPGSGNRVSARNICLSGRT